MIAYITLIYLKILMKQTTFLKNANQHNCYKESRITKMYQELQRKLKINNKQLILKTTCHLLHARPHPLKNLSGRRPQGTRMKCLAAILNPTLLSQDSLVQLLSQRKSWHSRLPQSNLHGWVPKVPISAETALATNVENNQPSQGICPGPSELW